MDKEFFRENKEKNQTIVKMATRITELEEMNYELRKCVDDLLVENKKLNETIKWTNSRLKSILSNCRGDEDD